MYTLIPVSCCRSGHCMHCWCCGTKLVPIWNILHTWLNEDVIRWVQYFFYLVIVCNLYTINVWKYLYSDWWTCNLYVFGKWIPWYKTRTLISCDCVSESMGALRINCQLIIKIQTMAGVTQGLKGFLVSYMHICACLSFMLWGLKLGSVVTSRRYNWLSPLSINIIILKQILYQRDGCNIHILHSIFMTQGTLKCSQYQKNRCVQLIFVAGLQCYMNPNLS